MRARQRKIRELRMIEGCPHPARGRMARAAIVREGGGHVIGIRGSIKVSGVAAVAIHGSSLELAADVARGAIQLGVHAGQREAGDRRMIERCAEPVVRAVAGFAGRGEIQRFVVNHARRVQVIHHVAGSAVRAQAGELPHGGIRVARNAVQRRMRPQERKAILVVLHVLNRDAPALHRVAFLAAASKLSAVQVRMAIHAFRSNA